MPGFRKNMSLYIQKDFVKDGDAFFFFLVAPHPLSLLARAPQLLSRD